MVNFILPRRAIIQGINDKYQSCTRSSNYKYCKILINPLTRGCELLDNYNFRTDLSKDLVILIAYRKDNVVLLSHFRLDLSIEY